LVRVADADQLASGLGGHVQQFGQHASADHSGLVDDEHASAG